MNRFTSVAFLLIALLFSTTLYAQQVQIEKDGVTYNGYLNVVDGNMLQDPTILMLHGTLAHGQMEIMKGLQSVLGESGINSLAISLSLGQSNRTGMYDCASTHTHKHTDSLDEVGMWLDWLKEKGADNISLLGHSRGGNQIAWFAAENPDAGFKRVVLIAPQLWDMAYEQKGYQKRYGESLDALYTKAKKLVAEGKGDTLLTETDFIYCEDTSVRADSFVNYYEDDQRKDTAYMVTKIQQPTLVVAGSEDTVVKNVEEKIQSTDTITVVTVDGAGHMFRDLYQYDIVAAIEELLAQ